MSEAPTPKPLPLGHGKRCLPSALDAKRQVFIKTVGSTLGRRRWFAKNDVGLASPPSARRERSGCLAPRAALQSHHRSAASCSNLFDDWCQRLSARVGFDQDCPPARRFRVRGHSQRSAAVRPHYRFPRRSGSHCSPSKRRSGYLVGWAFFSRAREAR
jgi:hypothetical protein